MAPHSPSPSALIPVLSISRCKAPMLGRRAMATDRGVWRRQSVLSSGPGQSRPASASRLASSPVAYLSGRPNSARSVRLVWIAASENTACRPRVPVCVANHCVSGSRQIDSEPRCLSAELSACQFVVRQARGFGLPMPSSYHAGFTRRILQADLCSMCSRPVCQRDFRSWCWRVIGC